MYLPQNGLILRSWKSITAPDFAEHVTLFTKLQMNSCNAKASLHSEKTKFRQGNGFRRCNENDTIRNTSQSTHSLQINASSPWLARTSMSIWHQHPTGATSLTNIFDSEFDDVSQWCALIQLLPTPQTLLNAESQCSTAVLSQTVQSAQGQLSDSIEMPSVASAIHLGHLVPAEVQFLCIVQVAIDKCLEHTLPQLGTKLGAESTSLKRACSAAVYENPESRDISTADFVSFDHPSDDVTSDMTHRYSSSLTTRKRGSAATISTNINSKRNTVSIGKTKPQFDWWPRKAILDGSALW